MGVRPGWPHVVLSEAAAVAAVSSRVRASLRALPGRSRLRRLFSLLCWPRGAQKPELQSTGLVTLVMGLAGHCLTWRHCHKEAGLSSWWVWLLDISVLLDEV